MRCECCDNPLSDVDATAKFVDKDGSTTRFVNMCKKCRGFLPPDVKIRTRHDLETTTSDDPYVDDSIYNFGEYDGDEDA